MLKLPRPLAQPVFVTSTLSSFAGMPSWNFQARTTSVCGSDGYNVCDMAHSTILLVHQFLKSFNFSCGIVSWLASVGSNGLQNFFLGYAE